MQCGSGHRHVRRSASTALASPRAAQRSAPPAGRRSRGTEPSGWAWLKQASRGCEDLGSIPLITESGGRRLLRTAADGESRGGLGAVSPTPPARRAHTESRQSSCARTRAHTRGTTGWVALDRSNRPMHKAHACEGLRVRTYRAEPAPRGKARTPWSAWTVTIGGRLSVGDRRARV